ncbi:MAG: hypothetical protein GY811_06370 [Myxococcales bacterium]|nr:hypothetical protein [Myxococcales bacterium]
MKTQLLAASLMLVSTFACKGELEGEEPAEKPVEKKKSNVVKLKTAVPYGMHLACEDVFPDTAIFTETMGDEIGEIRDMSRSNSSATVVCSLIRAGEPPSSPKELKTLEEKYAKLGVLPGDEYCMISAYCSLDNDEDTFKAKCEEDGNQRTSLEGQFACVRATEKGAEYSYTYKFIEPDTKCSIEAMAGPSVNDEAMVKNCAVAAREAMTTASVSNPK